MKRKNTTINVNIWMFIVLVVSFFSIVIKLAFISLAPKTDGIDLKAFVENRNTEKDMFFPVFDIPKRNFPGILSHV